MKALTSFISKSLEQSTTPCSSRLIFQMAELLLVSRMLHQFFPFVLCADMIFQQSLPIPTSQRLGCFSCLCSFCTLRCPLGNSITLNDTGAFNSHCFSSIPCTINHHASFMSYLWHTRKKTPQHSYFSSVSVTNHALLLFS